MERITKNSPAHEKLLALIKVQAAISALKMVEEVGLGSVNIDAARDDLFVYERQLTGYITGEEPKKEG